MFRRVANNIPVFVLFWGLELHLRPHDIKLPKSGELPKPISDQIQTIRQLQESSAKPINKLLANAFIIFRSILLLWIQFACSNHQFDSYKCRYVLPEVCKLIHNFLPSTHNTLIIFYFFHV
jgi:hypothetical protein